VRRIASELEALQDNAASFGAQKTGLAGRYVTSSVTTNQDDLGCGTTPFCVVLRVACVLGRDDLKISLGACVVDNTVFPPPFLRSELELLQTPG